MLMDVLIVEQNELLATVLADALADEGIAAAVVPDDEEALAACQPDMPQVVVTGINRRRDDMRGLPHDSPHSQMAPNICAKRGWAASIWANRSMSGSRRKSVMFGMSS